ncbi:MAG: Lrp/AsnC family transcriptional regulator [Anaerolineaceae bacterium]|nr:Lrp/AsnC family transcriptional regulator [Anaerolineaceae bacterium]
MAKSRSEIHSENNNVLRLGSVHELPDHKTAVELDDLDRALIETQLEDPFFSYSDFAEKWGITQATIRNRIRRLKTSGVIDVVTVINPYKVGFETFAMIGVRIKAESSPEKFAAALERFEGVSGITMVAGSFDFFITYVCRNMEEYRRFITEQLRNIPEIESLESFIGLDLYERKFLVGLIR